MVKQVKEHSTKLHPQPTFSYPTAFSSINTLAWELLLLLTSDNLTLTKSWTENKHHSHYPPSLTVDHWDLQSKSNFPMRRLPISHLLHLDYFHSLLVRTLGENVWQKVCDVKASWCYFCSSQKYWQCQKKYVSWTLSVVEKSVLIP